MLCPKCNSENTQRLEVIYEGGTQEINTTGLTVGGAHGAGGGAVTKTQGQAQSKLAQKAAPPEKQEYTFSAALTVVGILMTGATGIWFFVSLLLIGVGGYTLYAAFAFNSKDWPNLYQHWSESWLCNKCGTIYHQA